MAKLYFKYGAMTAGKTIDVITTAYKYNSRDMHAIIIKPKVDTKANDYVASRIGLYKSADIVLAEDDSIIERIKKDETNNGLFKSPIFLPDVFSKLANFVMICSITSSDIFFPSS